jgi:uncharacterized membrane protein YkoI
MARESTTILALALWALGSGATLATEAEVRVVTKSPCLTQSETREEIKGRRLQEPFAALKEAAAEFKAEALSAKLCRSGEEFVYEIALLHRDGRLLHVVTDALTGKLIAGRNLREPLPKN